MSGTLGTFLSSRKIARMRTALPTHLVPSVTHINCHEDVSSMSSYHIVKKHDSCHIPSPSHRREKEKEMENEKNRRRVLSGEGRGLIE